MWYLVLINGASKGRYYLVSCSQGRIQDLLLGGAWVGEGYGDRSPGVGGETPGSSGGLRNYRHLFERQFWTNHTIFTRPKKLDFEP